MIVFVVFFVSGGSANNEDCRPVVLIFIFVPLSLHAPVVLSVLFLVPGVIVFVGAPNKVPEEALSSDKGGRNGNRNRNPSDVSFISNSNRTCE